MTTDTEGQRLKALEVFMQEQKMRAAVETNDRKHMDIRFGAMSKSIDELKTMIAQEAKDRNETNKKFIWLFVAAIGSATASFVISGGLAPVS